MNQTEAYRLFSQVCHRILAIQHNKGFIAYAKSYAKRILEERRYWDAEYVVAQIPYLECNLTMWRGSEARKSKLILKEVMKCLK